MDTVMPKYTKRQRAGWQHARGEFGRVEVRGYGQTSQSSNPEVVNPYGRRPIGQAHRLGEQFSDPLSTYFGVRPQFADTRRGQRKEARFDARMQAVEQGTSPLAQYMQQAGAFLPQIFGQAKGVGERIASQAPGVFDNIRAQVQQSLGQLGGIQERAGQQAGQAQNFLDQASSPIASQALFQNALRSGLEGVQSGAAGRGLLDAGTAQAREETMGRDLAAQFAQNQFANQQAALQGAQGALGAQAGLLPVGAQLAGMEGAGLQQLAQMLQAGYQLPQEALESVFQQFAAYQNPQLALLGLTGPQVATSSRGGGFNVI